MDINSIKNPKFLKNLSYKQLDDVCKDIRKEIIDKTIQYGGHLSSNLGVVELTVALHKTFDFSIDKLFLDVGHQCYTHKILTGRSLENLRTSKGVAGFPKREESIYDIFEGGHSSNSISNALGYAVSRDLKNENYNVVCVIGDASISNGLSFEALNDSRLSDHKIIIILNDNGMSISKNVGTISKLFSNISTSGLYNKTKLTYKRFASKSPLRRKFYEFLFKIKNGIKRFLIRGNFFVDMGLNYIGIVDGHNIKSLEKAFKRAEKAVKSTIIHVKTIKGLGYKQAEEDNVGYYHGISANNNSNDKKDTSWSDLYSQLFTNLMNEKENTVLISPAMFLGSKFENFEKQFPNRVFDVGIAEEHAVSFAAGFALNGLKPYVSMYSTFAQRAFDEISHDVAREKIPVVLLLDRAGLANGDGDTHQGIFDESELINIPNSVVCMASNASEAQALINTSYEYNSLFVIRHPKGTVESSDNINIIDLKLGAWTKIINNDNKKVVVSFGPVINKIKDYLLNNKLEYDLINAIYQKPLDLGVLSTDLLNYDEIIIINYYATENGFNFHLINHLLKNNYKGKIVSKAISCEFIKAQSTEETLNSQKIDLNSIFNIK